MKVKWVAAFALIMALGLATAALAAGNDNDVEWNGTGHIPGSNICGDANFPYRYPVGSLQADQAVTIRARVYQWDLTGMTIWYTNNASAAAQSDWSSVAAAWEANWGGCGGAGDMDIYRGVIPAQNGPRVWYKIEYIDGTDHDWRRGSGEGMTGFYDDDGGWTTGSTSLYYDPETITRCEPEVAAAPVGGQSTVCIYVQGVVDLYGADFEMSFPGMVGIATVVDENSGISGVQILRSSWIPANWGEWYNTVDNATGDLHYTVYPLASVEMRTGSGPIACMRFQSVDGEGMFDLTFTWHDLVEGVTYRLIENTAHTCTVRFYDPTAVVLARFEAWPIATGYRVQWETVDEIDNVGFNLYRSTTLEGSRVKLNRALIPAKNPGSPSGAVYDWYDIAWLSRGRSYFYWLEDVDIHGHTTMHGPAKLRATLATVE